MPLLIFLLNKNSYDFLNWLHAAEKGHSGEQGLGPERCLDSSRPRAVWGQSFWIEFCTVSDNRAWASKCSQNIADEDCLYGLILPVCAPEEILQLSSCVHPLGARGEFMSKYRGPYYWY